MIAYPDDFKTAVVEFTREKLDLRRWAVKALRPAVQQERRWMVAGQIRGDRPARIFYRTYQFCLFAIVPDYWFRYCFNVIPTTFGYSSKSTYSSCLAFVSAFKWIRTVVLTTTMRNLGIFDRRT
jgi:hypothetical protein